MATEHNAMATEYEVYAMMAESVMPSERNRLCTKDRFNYLKDETVKLNGSYESNQIIKYDDIESTMGLYLQYTLRRVRLLRIEGTLDGVKFDTNNQDKSGELKLSNLWTSGYKSFVITSITAYASQIGSRITNSIKGIDGVTSWSENTTYKIYSSDLSTSRKSVIKVTSTEMGSITPIDPTPIG